MIPIGKSLKFQKKNKVFTEAYCFGKCGSWIEECVGDKVSTDSYEIFCALSESKLDVTIKSKNSTQAAWVHLQLNEIQLFITAQIESDVRLNFIHSVTMYSKY